MAGVKAGELFVEFSTHKEGALFKALVKSKEGLKSVTSMGLETKAAILGLFYGFERLTQSSAQWGNGLHRFGLLTGRSTQEIQKWGYAALLAGGHAEDMQKAFSSAQNIQAQVMAGNTQAIGPMEQIIQELRKHGQNVDALKMIRDPMYMLKQMVAFTKMTRGPMAGYANMLMQQLGFGPEAIADWASRLFNMRNIRGAPTMSEGESRAFNHFTGFVSSKKFGIQKHFADFLAQHLPLIEQDMTTLANVINMLVDAIGPVLQFLSLKNAPGKKVGDWLEKLDVYSFKLGQAYQYSPRVLSANAKELHAKVMAMRAAKEHHTQHTTNVSNHFTGITDHKELAKHVRHSVNEAHADLVRKTAAQSTHHPARQ